MPRWRSLNSQLAISLSPDRKARTYTINSLAPGKYKLTATAPGFSVYDSGVVSLAEGQMLTVDARLALASVQSVVQVNGIPTWPLDRFPLKPAA